MLKCCSVACIQEENICAVPLAEAYDDTTPTGDVDTNRSIMGGDEERDSFYSVKSANSSITDLFPVQETANSQRSLQTYAKKAAAAIDGLWREQNCMGWTFEKYVPSDICTVVLRPNATTGGVKVSSREGGLTGRVWMAEALMPFPAEAVVGLIRECEKWHIWNNRIEKYAILGQLGPPADKISNGGSSGMLVDVTYMREKADGVIAARDFVDIRAIGIRTLRRSFNADADDGATLQQSPLRPYQTARQQQQQQQQHWAYIVGGESIDYQGVLPKKGGYTRGARGHTGFIIKPDRKR
jgi:hypothetical protein